MAESLRDLTGLAAREAFSDSSEREKKLLKRLAAYSHAAWAGWMQYVFSRGKMNEKGEMTLSAHDTARWLRQISTSYLELSAAEKESDLKEARKILEITRKV